MINIVGLSSVERVDESVSIRVSIYNKVEFFLVSGQEVFKSLSLWLRGTLWPRIVQKVRISNLS